MAICVMRCWRGYLSVLSGVGVAVCLCDEVLARTVC